MKAIRNSGGGQNAMDECNPHLVRVNYLEKTKRYGRLLSQLTKANDRSNFLALTLEANFAHQFESGGRELIYEPKQDANKKGSIDFLRNAPTGHNVFFEIRLLQQTRSVTEIISEQLKESNFYRVHGDGKFEQSEVIRIQSTVIT